MRKVWNYPGNVDDELGNPCVVDEAGCAICSVLDDGFDEDEVETHARLIAAAPDMLDALKAAAERLRIMASMTGCRSDDDWVWAAQDMVKAAIAKAEGTAP